MPVGKIGKHYSGGCETAHKECGERIDVVRTLPFTGGLQKPSIQRYGRAVTSPTKDHTWNTASETPSSLFFSHTTVTQNRLFDAFSETT